MVSLRFLLPWLSFSVVEFATFLNHAQQIDSQMEAWTRNTHVSALTFAETLLVNEIMGIKFSILKCC